MVLDQLRVCVFQCLADEEGKRRMCVYVYQWGESNETNAVASNSTNIIMEMSMHAR